MAFYIDCVFVYVLCVAFPALLLILFSLRVYIVLNDAKCHRALSMYTYDLISARL